MSVNGLNKLLIYNDPAIKPTDLNEKKKKYLDNNNMCMFNTFMCIQIRYKENANI